MDTSNWIAIIGWPITFSLGLISVLMAQKLAKKKKIVAWTVIGESNILTEEVLGGFGVPIKVLINGHEEESLSTICVRVGNKGNIEITNVKVVFNFGPSAKVNVGKFSEDLGTYKQKVLLVKRGNTAVLGIEHINPNQSFDMDFLVSNYELGDISADMAEAGVELRLVESTKWDFPKGVFESLVLGFLGVRHDPTARNTGLIVEEIKKLRETIEKNFKR